MLSILSKPEFIKKLLIINEDFAQKIHTKDQVSFLLEKALKKRADIYSQMQKIGSDINPLIIIQVPNQNDDLIEKIENYLESEGITYDNQQLAIWLAKRKENREDIEDSNAPPIALIIKQAVATGWDCPRAYILVKLRDNMSETFELILRMFQTKDIIKYFLPINSCLNPVALFCSSLAFRRHLKRYLTCCFKTKSPPTDFELTRRN